MVVSPDCRAVPAISSDWCSVGEPILRVILSVLAADSGLCVAGRNHTLQHWGEEWVVISTVAPNKKAYPLPS